MRPRSPPRCRAARSNRSRRPPLRRASKEPSPRRRVIDPMAKRPIRTGLPTREQILEFIESSDQPAGKREISRAFGLSGADKVALKQLLRDMGDEGLIDS